MSDNRIFHFLKHIDNADIGTEVLTIVKKERVDTVQDLALLTEQTLSEHGMHPTHIKTVSALLQTHYDLALAVPDKAAHPAAYEVQDSGSHLIVNGVRVNIPTKPGTLQKDELLTLFTLHSQHEPIAAIAEQIDRSISAVRNYLIKAQVITPRRYRTHTRKTSKIPHHRLGPGITHYYPPFDGLGGQWEGLLYVQGPERS